MVTGLVMVVTVWRLPTLVYALRNFEKVKAELMKKNTGKLSEEAAEVYGKNSEVLGYAAGIIFFFKHWLKDLPYVPVFLLCFLAPWRIGAWVIEMLKTPFVDDLQSGHRSQVIRCLKRGLKDWLSALGGLLLLCTIWRLPFFYFILKRNGHIDNQRTVHSLSVKQCLIRTFKEWIKDLPFIPFALLLIIATPWRIPRIFSVLTGFSMNFPRSNDFSPLMRLRLEMLYTALGKFLLDYVTIVLMLVLFLTGWRAITALKVFISHVKRSYSGEKISRSLVSKILHQVLQLLIDALMLVLMLLIVVLLVKLPQFFRR